VSKSISTALAVTLLGSVAYAASAAVSKPVEPSQLVSAFTGICLKNVGDQAAQRAAAQGQPWKLVTRKSENGEERLRSEDFALGIRAADNNCALTAELGKSVSLDDLKAAFIKETAAHEPQALPQSDSVYWIIAAGPQEQRYAIGLKASATSGRNLATFAVSQPKGH
jgi:hypothetical protein